METFKAIPGFEDRYEVSDMGNVRRLNKTKRYPALGLLKPRSHVDGYLFVSFDVDGKQHHFTIHRLVMLAFVGSRPDGMVVNHKSGDKSDNRLCNLEYVTHKQNSQHSIITLGKHCGANKGERRAAKLTPDQVQQIRNLHKAGIKRRVIAKQFGVTEGNISSILVGRTWKQESHS